MPAKEGSRSRRPHRRSLQVVRTYCTYIMASRSRVLYTGVTNDLARRVSEHKRGLSGFTGKYRVTRLVYFEEFADIREAIAREKAIKGWKRSRKIELFENRNPTWEDLADPSRLRRSEPAPSRAKG